MYRDLNLQIPEALYSSLKLQAVRQGVSLDTLCLSLLSEEREEGPLEDPNYYQSMTLDTLRKEIKRVIGSDLSHDEVKKRVNTLEFQISRRYIR
jgi:phenylalanyl-tRNA synthetase beta subunit